MALQNIGTEDRAAWYEIRRNELLELLGKTSSLNISPEHAEELAAIGKKCLENQFEIVLMGKFQGGKSTTFDTLCGGRDLSPRGLGGGGIKTSAAVISAQNISDGEEKNGMREWAELTFKSKAELTEGIFEVIKEYGEPEAFRKKFDPADWGKLNPSVFAQKIDLDNPSDKELLLQTIAAAWTKGNWGPDMTDNLKIATLILDFYGTEDYRALCKKSIMDVYDFQKLIAFPNRWQLRWKAKRASQFTFDEIAFVFIARVLLRIRSKHLARLGCRITDCPGLFANAYDTRVAMQTINSSDAVWYLMDGEEQIGNDELKHLVKIKPIVLNDRSFLSGNMRTNHAYRINEILPVTDSILEEQNLPVKTYPYNARLAFLAEQGSQLLEGGLSEHDRKNMEIDSGLSGQPPKKMWVSMIQEVGQDIKIPSIKNIAELNKEAVETARKESLVEGILTPIREKIISGKARSILLDNGSARAAKALTTYEGELRTTEIAAENDEQEWQRKTEESRKVLENFVSWARKQIERSTLNRDKNIKAQWLTSMLLEASLQTETCIRECAETFLTAADGLAFKEFFWTEKSWQEKATANAAPRLAEIINLHIFDTLNKWKADEGNTPWHENILATLHDIREDIQEHWEEEISANDLLRGVFYDPNPDEITNLTKLQESLQRDYTIQKALSKDKLSTIGYLWERFKKLFSSEKDTNLLDEKRLERWMDAFKGQFKDSETRDNINQSLNDYFQNVIQSVLDNLKDKLNTMREDFNTRVQNNEHVLGEKETERREIAEKNRRIRTEEIEPVRKEIQAFQQQVEKEIGRIRA